jgi:hypothetical protein
MSDTSRLYPNKNKEFNHHIVIDSPRVTLNKNEITMPADKRGGFSIPYPNTSSENNFYYTFGETQLNYMHNHLYINKLIHYNIEGLTSNNSNMVGELIIEHQTLTNTTKLYSCYLLETKSILLTDENEIDKMLSMPDKQSDNLDVDMNMVIPKQDSCIVYKSDNNYVCVFTTPIIINTASKEKIINNFANVTTLFNISPTQGNEIITKEPKKLYVVIPGSNISKRDAEEIYIDCNPTGVSEEEINTYSVPINSKMASQSQESDYMKTTVNYGLFMLTALVSYIIVPLFYKNVVIDTTTMEFDVDINKRFTRIRSADICIGIGFIIIISSLFGAGTAESDMYSTSVAMFISVFYILSVALIQLQKTQSVFMTTEYKGNKIVSDYDSSEGKNISAFNLDDIGNTLMIILKFVFFGIENISAFIATMIILACILGVMIGVNSISGSQFGTIMGSSAVPLLVIINTIMLLKANENKRNQ